MTRRTTLFIVFAFEIALLLLVAAWSALADTEKAINGLSKDAIKQAFVKGQDGVVRNMTHPEAKARKFNLQPQSRVTS